MAIRVRKARDSDLPRVFEIERRSYPPQLRTSHDILRYRHRLFGIWVAELDGEVAGFNTCVPIRLRWPNPDLAAFRRNRQPHYLPWFQRYEAERSEPERFTALLNTSSAVETRFQAQGVCTALVRNTLALARRHGLGLRVSALPCEYAPFQRKTGGTIEDYIRAVTTGEVKDRFLALYRRLGFVFHAPLADYEPDRGSLNYCVFSYRTID